MWHQRIPRKQTPRKSSRYRTQGVVIENIDNKIILEKKETLRDYNYYYASQGYIVNYPILEFG